MMVPKMESKPPKDECWINISNLMNNEIEPFHVYVILKTNRYNMRNIS